MIDDPIKITNQIFEKFSIKHDEAFERKLTTRIGNKKLKSKHSYSYEKFFRTSGEVENMIAANNNLDVNRDITHDILSVVDSYKKYSKFQ